MRAPLAVADSAHELGTVSPQQPGLVRELSGQLPVSTTLIDAVAALRAAAVRMDDVSVNLEVEQDGDRTRTKFHFRAYRLKR